jgi:hypothetical protein
MSATARQSRYDELIDAVFAICDGEPAEELVRRIEPLLAEDPTARLIYLQCLEMHLQMDRLAAARGDDPDLRVDERTDCRSVLQRFGVQGPEKDECRMMNDELAGAERPSSHSSDIHHSSFIIHHSAPLSSLLSGILLPYIVATLVLSVALLSAATWTTAVYQEPSPIALGTLPTTIAVAGSAGKPIGKITKAENCNWWGHPSHSAKPGDPVAVGRKYALQAGVLEIAYDGGATVVLQGHCAYEVDSATSGVLYAGTAKVKVAAPAGAARAGPFVLNTPDFVFRDTQGDFDVAVLHMDGKQMTRMLNVSGKVSGRMSQEALKSGWCVRFHGEPREGGRNYCWEVIKDTDGRDRTPGRNEDEEKRTKAGG